MSLIASMVKFASKLHPRAKKMWAEFPVPQMCKYVAAWSLKNNLRLGNAECLSTVMSYALESTAAYALQANSDLLKA